MKIEIPELCLVALVGASGSGKSSFAKKHFKATEVLSSDYFRGLVSDDESDQSATEAAFDSLYYIAIKRLERGRLTVIDATSVQQFARKKIIDIARSHDVLPVAVVFDMPEDLCVERNRTRADRNVTPNVVRRHVRDLAKSLRSLQREGFRYVHILHSQEEVDSVEIVRAKLWNDKRDETGPFDIIGDIHGCYDELTELLEKMEYAVDRGSHSAIPPAGRRAVFLGDLCDRGPANVSVLRLVMNMVESGSALCVPGNHDVKLLRKLRGNDVKMTHGLDLTVKELEQEPQEFIDKAMQFIDGLVSHYVLDQGKLVVSHAGLSEKFHGRSSGRVRGFCLYGDTTGETDEFGLPVRLNWAEEYRGKALVVYGHIPSSEARSLNNTICIDTGCVFGGKLSAYRYPEGELVEVHAKREYYAPIKPLNYGTVITANGCCEPNIIDVLGKRRVSTRMYREVAVSEEASALTLEIMSRFSANPRWLIYLPPTMSPSGTSKLETFLEHPLEAFDYYKKRGVTKIICEEKHMGSRAVIVLCRNSETAKTRFGIDCDSQKDVPGIIYTRTGRHFFAGAEKNHEQAILLRLQTVLNNSNFWDAFSTDWVCLDTELMPWSAKARALILEQYAPTGMAGRGGLAKAVSALESAKMSYNGSGVSDINIESGTPGDMNLAAVLEDYKKRLECLELYTESYRRYCWQVSSADDYRIAPFHVLATEGKVWHDENHPRHLAVIRDYIASGGDPIFIATNHLTVDLNDDASAAAAVDWWLNLTNSGGEGMVVKPLDFTARDKNALLQPAVKCRGREYLRIIYGPDYTAAVHLDRLRKRSLRRKQELALSEFALGMESLERFVNKEPFYRVHECVFAVLALENETVDPRL
jgi:protein phosphatase